MNTFGLDIGFNSIKVIKLSKEGSKFKLLNYGLAPSPSKAIMSEAESDLILLAEAIKKLVRDAKIQDKEVVTALPETKVITSIIEFPPISTGELAEAIKWEAEQYVPQPLNEVRLAYDIIEMPKKGDPNGKMKVLLVAAPLRLIDKYTKIINLSDLHATTIETEIIAILRALREDIGDKLTMIINSGASATQIGIVENGNLILTRSISTGGVAITRSIASELNLELDQAEEYKKAYGLDATKLEGKVAKAIKPIFDTITVEIKKAMSFYKEKNSQNFINRVILVGGTARLPNLISYLAQELSIEVSIGNPWSNIILDPQTGKVVNELGNLYACVIGLAMKDLE